jgi:protein-L-isoaspartate(D-aspartate) O-methyltransferase
MPQQDVPITSAARRAIFARMVAAEAGAGAAVEAAFAAVPREPFAGPPPWWVVVHGPGGACHVEVPAEEAGFLYQDALVALDRAKGLNIGEPVLHARCLEALALQSGEAVIQVGAGSGYYTAILAELVGGAGRVTAYEIEPALAARAVETLRGTPQVRVVAATGAADVLPEADAIYVCAGLAQPHWAWLDALRPGGRLVFPLQPEGGYGGMLLVTKPVAGGLAWPARFVQRAGFVGCRVTLPGAAEAGLAAAFAGGLWDRVRAFRLDPVSDASCWFAGNGWWLSTEAPGGGIGSP